MDKITKSLLDSFASENELGKLGEDKQFEHFANFAVISKLHRSSFELESVSTGAGGDAAIDGIAILVNGKLIEDVEELDDIVGEAGHLDCDVVFIQSKTSSNFEGSQIGSFIFGVKDFISDAPKMVHNEKLKSCRAIWDAIVEKSAFMVNRRPACKLFYVTTGKWIGDQNLVAVVTSGRREIEESGLFETVSMTPLGANEIQKYYHETRNKLSATINFQSRITLPDIEGVKEAYLGVLPYKDFMSLVQDENDAIYNIFYDNVRDFQGENEVNKKIKGTLAAGNFELFCVLNNGVTIVATSLTPAGNRFTLRDYQIVNGCQTSNVLHGSQAIAGIENVHVPVKIIVTEDEEIKNEITVATNSQTEVKAEQLEALTVFQKKLEQYFAAMKGDGKLYYERRAQQYHSSPGVRKTQIISIPIQIKAFASAFLMVPHAVSGYYGTIVQRFKGQIFGQDHKYSPYYVSALCYFRLEGLFRNGIIDVKYKKVRFHLIMLARMIGMGVELPALNSGKMDRLCDTFAKTLNDDGKCADLFRAAVEKIEEADFDLTQKQFKSETETMKLIDLFDAN
ncbi:AIPR family protein [Herbaspirillum frisingense]|uniref:AIPR family protein n=1 Tax=Herbaspirillum frisingense TaxID=92645 RepID=UPI00191C945E|nr:AIPR family protein [Herbaspirillum frisingense]